MSISRPSSTPTRSSRLEPVERDAATILTPHAGELARLLDTRLLLGRRAPPRGSPDRGERFGATVLLKGADTIVASPDGAVVVCDAGPPSLATAGTGDVLTGVVGAFLSKGLDASTAAAAAALAHGRAASLAAHATGLVAGDLLELLPAAIDG